MAKPDLYPLPRVDDLLATLSGAKVFTKLDIKHAYQRLEEESKKFTTVNTTKGLFQFQRLPFGVSATLTIFQRIMESLLQGLPQTGVDIDEIVVADVDEVDQLSNLNKVMSRLCDAGLTLRPFSVSSVEHLGHVINAEGIHLSVEKVRAIQDAPEPKSVSELKSFLGLANYYSKFLFSLSIVLSPLYRLLQKNVLFQWMEEHRTAFKRASNHLC